MTGNHNKHLIGTVNYRLILYGCLLLILNIVYPVPREARSNACSGLTLSRVYTGNISLDILAEGRTFPFEWDVNHKPLSYQRSKKNTGLPPLSKQYFDIFKRKGISANGPDPAAPAFSGIFPGYPPSAKSQVYQLPFLVLSPETGNNTKIRPPPVK